MNAQSQRRIKQLMDKGVEIPNPQSIHIGNEVDIKRISGVGVKIHSGCKLFGASTAVLEGANLGYESPVTIQDCQIGPHVGLAGGFFRQAVFLEGASMGSGAHVREGTILEEQAGGAHTVALKQTILFPFVTLGSLINFCDCFLSGGTSRKNHSEVGSSYIHFNFTPHQDKATASLLGDVPHGVMLDQPPIFLGGQGGLVGPCRVGFGNVIAAGSIFRKDALESGRLIMAAPRGSGSLPFKKDRYQGIKRIALNNIIYISNLSALLQWYHFVRTLFISDRFPRLMLASLKEKVGMALDERMKRLEDLCLKMPASVDAYGKFDDPEAVPKTVYQQRELYEKWSDIKPVLNAGRAFTGDERLRDSFLETVQFRIQAAGKDYIRVIQSLSHDGKASGVHWLEGIVRHISRQALRLAPSLGGYTGLTS